MKDIFKDFLIQNPNTDKKQLKKNFDYLLNDIIYIINHSIIEGKYILNNEPEIFETCLQEFLFEVQDLINDNDNLIDKYSNVFNYLINSYSLFYHRVYDLYTKNIIEFVDKDIYKEVYHITFRNYKDLIRITELNIELAKLDHQFINDISLLKNLFRIKNNLRVIRLQPSLFNDNIIHNKFTTLRDSIEFKVDFLIDKWYLRSKTKLVDYNRQIINYKHTSSYTNLIDGEYFKKYQNKISYIYEVKEYDYQYILNEEFLQINKSNYNNLSFCELHTLIKYFKDSENSNIIEFQKITEAFKGKLSNCDVKNVFEYFSYSIAYQYSLNNYYSLFCGNFIKNNENINCENVNHIFDDFHTKYLDVKMQSSNLTDNFFLEFKFLDTSLFLLNNLLVKYNNYDVVTITKAYFEKIKSVIEIYQNKITWSLKNNNYIFKLPYQESKIVYNENINIYFSSSFLLPKVNEDILIEKRKIEILYQRINTIYNSEKQIFDLNEIKKSNQILESNYKADNKKLIETVTVFTAIISFIIGSIGAFKFIETFSQALLFITIFSISISIFVLLIFASTKGKRRLKEMSLYIITIYALMLIFLSVFVLPFYNQDLKNKSTYNKKELDSLYKIQNDSINELKSNYNLLQKKYKNQ